MMTGGRSEPCVNLEDGKVQRGEKKEKRTTDTLLGNCEAIGWG